MSQRGSGTSEWKRLREHWPTNRTGLTDNRRPFATVTANPGGQGMPDVLLIVGNTAVVRNNSLPRIVRLQGHLVRASRGPTRPPPQPHPPRGRGAVFDLLVALHG